LGKPGVLHGSKSLVMQTEDGQVVEPHSISAGLDYPGIGPLHANLYDSGRGLFLSATDDDAVAAAFNLAKKEGIIPALESSHALASLEFLNTVKTKRSEAPVPATAMFTKDSVVVVCLSGRGDKDMATYMKAMETK
jgi:tryptophan synthase beta chain